ncbi:hypothetical protein LCGC14_0471990 [marine sediment metagenome]|uniref:Uncharacterized protein n=1 Tax=marine sediment metagenome TaxID=412755 RepID=A0A0F9VKS0_9ZZZZ
MSEGDSGRKTAESMARAMRVMALAMREYTWGYLQQVATARVVECEKRGDPAYWRLNVVYFSALVDVAQTQDQGRGVVKFLQGLEIRAREKGLETVDKGPDNGVGDKTTDQD